MSRARAIAMGTLFIIGGAGMTACSGGGADDHGAEGSPPGWSEDCEAVRSLEVAAETPTLAVVVDRTASGRDITTAPAVAEVLLQAQAEGLAMIAVAVDGPGVAPLVVGPMALDPRPGATSENADRARAIAVECAAVALRRSELLPTEAGSDVLAAVGAALRQQPSAILVLSDGVGTASVIDPAVLGWEADPLVVLDGLRAASTPLPPSGMAVTWVGAGETVTPLPDGPRASLVTMLSTLMSADGATVTMDSRTGEVPQRDVSLLPADVVVVPEVTQVSVGEATCVRIPGVMLFEPDSSTLVAVEALDPLVADLGSHPDWVARVDGHTADFGTQEGRFAMSTARAWSVVDALRAKGVTNPLDAVGFGATVPVANEWPNGPQGSRDLAASELNRRVDVRYGPVGVVDSVTC